MPLTSEAQILVDRMMAAGMQPVEIAKAIGVRSQQIRDIRRRKSSGNAYVNSLRVVAAGVADAIPASVGPEEHDSPAGTAGESPAAESTDRHATATIEAEDAPKDERSTVEKAKDRIKEMLLGGSPEITAAAPRKPAGGSVAGRRSAFVDQVVPIVALAVSLGADLLIADPYKPVGPTEDEAAALVRPWIAIMARQLEIAGQLSETSLDIIAALGATALYGRRAHATYRSIRERDKEHGSATTSSGARSGANSANNGHGHGYDGAYRDAAGAIVTGVGSGSANGRRAYAQVTAPAPYAQAADSAGGPAIDSRLIGNVRQGADPIADLYTRDAEGRRQAGLD